MGISEVQPLLAYFRAALSSAVTPHLLYPGCRRGEKGVRSSHDEHKRDSDEPDCGICIAL